MNISKINKNFLSILTVIMLLIMAVACKEEESYGPFDNASLDALITEAQSLVDNSEEGIQPGDYKPGSIKELQDVLTWAIWKKENSKDQSEIATAANRLSIYIEAFKKNIVTLAIPWVQQSNETMITISDNTSGEGVSGRLKQITKKPFTVELKIFVVDLNQMGYSNNMFANVMGDGGANGDRGCEIRYFSDGVVHLNVAGGGKSWQTTSSPAGLITSGKWIHVAYVNNINSHKVYFDGVEVLSSDAIYEDSDDDYPFLIGNTFPWQDRVMNALIQDFRIWTVGRTEAQINETLDGVNGDEANLEVYFPFNADLGESFSDFSGKFKAEFEKDIVWVPGGNLGGVEVDVSALNSAIKSIEDLIVEVGEGGTNNGDYPVSTGDYLQSLIDEANNLLTSDPKQSQVDEMVDYIATNIDRVKNNLVADAFGFFIRREAPTEHAVMISPNIHPLGDYTIEFDVKIKSYNYDGLGEFFNQGEFGLWVYGYKDFSLESISQSGGLWNFTNTSGGWSGPATDPLVMKEEVWQHIAVVHDETARTTTLFVDGEEKGQTTDIGLPNNGGWGEGLRLGYGWGDRLNGSIKDFRVWNEARAAGNLNAEITGTEPNLEMYFPLDRVAGIRFKDVTGNYQAEMFDASWRLIE